MAKVPALRMDVILLIAITCHCSVVLGQSETNETDSLNLERVKERVRRIVGLKKPLPYYNTKYPFLVYLRAEIHYQWNWGRRKEYHQCGATIVNSRFLLSACSCSEYYGWRGQYRGMHNEGFDKFRVVIGYGEITDPNMGHHELWPDRNNKLEREGRICHPKYTTTYSLGDPRNRYDIALYKTQKLIPIGVLSPTGRHEPMVDRVKLPFNVP